MNLAPDTVTGKYLLTAFYVALDFGAAWILAWFVKRQLPGLAMLAGRNARLVSTLLGYGLLLTAAIGTLAWPLHSSRDQAIFFWLSLAGGFLLIYQYALRRLK
ncbi:MAG: hypothetical protein ACYDIC_17700 [Desulfobaccales bacterium]